MIYGVPFMCWRQIRAGTSGVFSTVHIWCMIGLRFVSQHTWHGSPSTSFTRIAQTTLLHSTSLAREFVFSTSSSCTTTRQVKKSDKGTHPQMLVFCALSRSTHQILRATFIWQGLWHRRANPIHLCLPEQRWRYVSAIPIRCSRYPMTQSRITQNIMPL